MSNIRLLPSQITVTTKISQQISLLVQAGFLPPDTLEKFVNGEVGEEWIRMNVTKNRKFILTHYPPAIQDLINSNKMPEYIEEVIFSGSSNASEIKQLIFNDDNVVKLLLPKKVIDMLEVNIIVKNI